MNKLLSKERIERTLASVEDINNWYTMVKLEYDKCVFYAQLLLEHWNGMGCCYDKEHADEYEMYYDRFVEAKRNMVKFHIGYILNRSDIGNEFKNHILSTYNDFFMTTEFELEECVNYYLYKTGRYKQ